MRRSAEIGPELTVAPRRSATVRRHLSHPPIESRSLPARRAMPRDRPTPHQLSAPSDLSLVAQTERQDRPRDGAQQPDTSFGGAADTLVSVRRWLYLGISLAIVAISSFGFLSRLSAQNTASASAATASAATSTTAVPTANVSTGTLGGACPPGSVRCNPPLAPSGSGSVTWAEAIVVLAIAFSLAAFRPRLHRPK